MTRRQDPIAITETELRTLTRDLEEVHHDTFPTTRSAIDELAEHLRDVPGSKAMNRRNFLIAGGALGGAVVLAACGSSGSTASKATTTMKGSSSMTPSGGDVDLAVAGLAAALENLAVQTYQGALDAATAGKLGTVPPAVAEFAKTAMSQHTDHAGAWNSVLTKAGHAKVTGVDVTVNTKVVKPAFAKVANVSDLAKLALQLEDVAAATYLNGVQNALTASSAIKVAMTIQPVEMQHAAILNLITGTYPIPRGFASTDGARSPKDKIG